MKTVVLVTHDMSAVKRFCTKAVYVAEGKIVMEGSPAEIAELYTEANIRGATKTQREDISDFSLKTIITNEEEKKVELNFSYKVQRGTESHIGISILRDGVSVAEISSELVKPITKSGVASYTLDTSLFNEGVYRVESALFLTKNRELVASSQSPISFTVKGFDISRGGAMRLENKWEYK